jgi:hypothetical protein
VPLQAGGPLKGKAFSLKNNTKKEFFYHERFIFLRCYTLLRLEEGLYAGRVVSDITALGWPELAK